MEIQGLCSRMALQIACLQVRSARDHGFFSLMNPRCSFPFQRGSDLYRLRRTIHIPCLSTISSSFEPDSVSVHHRLHLALDISSAVIPHPEKVAKGGEDAFFISDYDGGVLGVADGVSGWAEENVDPALFSRELMQHALAAVGSEEVGNCPRKIMAKADEATSAIGAATASERSGKDGSTESYAGMQNTIASIIATLASKDGILHIANLGDCGLRLVREGKVVFATSTQQHYFDCPYQLSSERGAQTAKDAEMYEVDVKKGDIIIVASDGLFDNVYDKDIEKIVTSISDSESTSAQEIATAVASVASRNATDSKYESPYCQQAILQGYDLPLWKKILGQKLTGGKLDDITVLAALVVDSSSRV